MSTPDDRAWLGSGIGRSGPGRLSVYCDRRHGEVLVRELRRDDGAGWWINPNTDMIRDDPTPLSELPPGTPLRSRLHLTVACPACSLNVAFTASEVESESTLSILDNLVDGDVSRIELSRLCAIVSNWR